MKRYRLIQTACLAAMAVGLASCSQEDLASLGVAEGTPVTFTATGLAMPQVETRATTDGTWEEGMMVGVKIGSEAKEYAVSPDATDPTKATLAATQGVTPFYWANATETKTVEAWYPYTAGQTAMPTLVVQQDQNIEANYVASDLLSAAQTVTYGDTDLQFTHRTAKITLNFTETESSGVSMKDAQVVLYNLSTANGNPATIRCLKASEDGNTYQALIVPQTFEAGNALFHVKLADGQAHSYAIDATIDFKAGSQYVFNVDFSDPQMNVIALSETIPWGSGNAGSGSLSVYNLANGDYYLSGQSGFRHYFVGTEAGLKAWAQYVNAGNLSSNCTLMKDINLTINADGSNNWLTIGNRNNPYTGTFDGAGYEIDNIIFRLGADGSGYDVGFLSCSSGIIQNLTIGENSIFECERGVYVGSIVGRMASKGSHGQIINCHSKATLKTTGNYAIGGIVGIASAHQNYSHLLIGCSFSGNITTPSKAGGIVGEAGNNQDVDHGNDLLYHFYMVGCYSTGKINVQSGSKAHAVGGIISEAYSYNYGRLAYVGCYSTAEGLSDLNASNVGGLLGCMGTGNKGIDHYLSSCYWSNYTGNSVGFEFDSTIENTAFVDGENINWATATANMNAAIKEWNAARDNLCQYHYEQTNGTDNPPTLVEGAPN